MAEDPQKQVKERLKNAAKVSRRAFMRVAKGATVTIVASACSITGVSVKDWLSNRPEGGSGKPAQTNQELLQNLFGTYETDVALIPASDHPYKPPGAGEWYAIEAECAENYKEQLCPRFRTQTVRGFARTQKTDSLVLFGSQVSNAATALVLGNAHGPEPQFPIRPQGGIADGWQAHLRWNMHAPPGEHLRLKQYNDLWIEGHQFIADSKTGEKFVPQRSTLHAGKSLEFPHSLADDYLLVTSLPRFNRGRQRILVFNGVYGPGTAASTSLLLNSSRADLLNLAKMTKGESYYQALFHVSVSTNENGQMEASQVRLVDAAPIYPHS